MNFNRTRPTTVAALVAAFFVLSLGGCTGGTKENPPTAGNSGEHNHAAAPAAATQGTDDADIKAERAKLSPEDQALVAAQEFCAISTDERLGAMGPPVKIVIQGKPVFLCCGGCQKKALANPEKTLAKVDELKAKTKADAVK